MAFHFIQPARRSLVLIVRNDLTRRMSSVCSIAWVKKCLALQEPQGKMFPVTCNLLLQVRQYSRNKKKRNRYLDSDSDSDSSDSDNEDNKRGSSAFWIRKMRTHHHVIDVNKDGLVSWDDFQILSKKFIELGNFSEDEKKGFMVQLKKFWEQSWGGSDNPTAFIFADDFIKSMQHVVNDSSLRKKVASPLKYFFRAVDHDKSGEISVDEYRLFYKCLGLSQEDADTAFKVIDVNGDGKLSVEEFMALGRMFFVSEDENHPSKHFWGPLVQ